MAENFVSFVGVANAGTERQLVPYAKTSSANKTPVIGTNYTNGTNTRTVNSTVIVNGFYATSNATNKDCVIELSIKDVDFPSRQAIYIIYNISVPAGTSFFLERAITLTPSQGLFFKATGGQMTISASCIEVNK